MATQVVVAVSDPVLTPAGRAVHPSLSADEVRDAVSVKALSQQVLQVTARSPRAPDAVDLANAVANSYVHYVNQVLPNGATGGPVQLLQPSTGAVPASELRLPKLASAGVVVGLLVGLFLSVALAGRDRRLRTRNEIARAIGVPVLTSLEAEPCRSVAHWQKLLDEYRPSAVVRWNLRRLLHRLAPAGADANQEIRVMAFADDRAALVAGPQLAAVAAALGITTALEPGHEEVWVRLRAACAVHDRSSSRPELRTAGFPVSSIDDPGQSSPVEWAGDSGATAEHAELTVSLLAVDRASPEVRPFGGANLISVSAGFATADDLARLALAAADAAQAVDGIVVVNPDQADATTGSAGDGEAVARPLTSAGRRPRVPEPMRRPQ
jgi:hypothetical protein